MNKIYNVNVSLSQLGSSFRSSSSTVNVVNAVVASGYLTGPVGPAGPKGDTGATGATGPIGLTGPQGIQGLTGPQGIQGTAGSTGATGAAGTNGTNGTNGAAATIAVGSTTTGAAGSSASVTNSGTSSAAVFNFTIPQGANGTNGTNGTNGSVWYNGTAAPSTLHNNGDYYLRTTTGDVYQQTAGAWGSPIENITGPTGASGSGTGDMLKSVYDPASKNTQLAADNAVVHLTGTETVAGVKTFSSAPVVPSAAFPESAVSGLVTDLSNRAPKFATASVSATNTSASHTTIQAALDALTSGGTIYLLDSSYTITSTLLVKGSNVRIVGNQTTTIQGDGSVVTTFLKSNSTTFTRLHLENLTFSQTNATPQGIGFDGSNMALGGYQNLYFTGFGTAISLQDTANLTFYNRFQDITIFNSNIGFNIGGTNPVNDNMFVQVRCAVNASGTGLNLTKGQSNNFYNCDFEPASITGTTGVKLAPTANGDVYDTNFYGVYVENNATGVSINSNSVRTSFFGGQIVANTVNVSDAGQDTQFYGADSGYALLNQFGAFNQVDSTSAAKTLQYLKNNTSFAHVSSNLVRYQLLNGTDSSNVLRLENPGTGKNISSTNGTTETFSVNGAGAVVATTYTGRILPRVSTATSTATPSYSTDSFDQIDLTAQAAAITSFTLSGTPVDGQDIIIRIKATGAFAIAAPTNVANSGVASFPTTTVSGKTITAGLRYDSTAAKWVCMAVDATGY